MAKKWQKFLDRLNIDLQDKVRIALILIFKGELDGLDIKAMKGTKQTFRCRIGKIRIIFKNNNGKNEIIDIGFRGDIYK